MLRSGVKIALGLDSMSLNDEADMLQEMRLVHLLQRAVNGNVEVPDCGQVLAMATANGAGALGMNDDVGTLTVGKKADLILVDRSRMERPIMLGDHPTTDLLVTRGQSRDVDTVIIGGEIVYREGKHLKLDKEGLENEIRGQINAVCDLETESFRRMIKGLKRKS